MVSGFDPKGMDPQRILEMLMKNPAAGGAVGGLAGSLLGGILMGKGGGKQLAKSAAKAGGLALVGAVAWKAWQQYQQSQQRAGGANASGPGVALPGVAAVAAPAAGIPRLPAPFDLESPAAARSGDALRVVQAMVAAAKADGVVDGAERQKILARADDAALSPVDRQFVADLLDRPMDLEAVVQGVDTRELATEIYAASALAIHPASRTERGYLDLLAARLGMEPGLAREIDRSVVAALEAPDPGLGA